MKKFFCLQQVVWFVTFVGIVWLVGCANRVPIVITQEYPEFVFPVVPIDYIGSRAANRHREAWAYLQNGDLVSAETRYVDLVESVPDFFPAHAALGWVRLARGEANAAILSFDRSAIAQSNYVPALVGRGEAMLALNDVEGALQSFEAALAEDQSLIQIQQTVQELRFTLLREKLQSARLAVEVNQIVEAKTLYEQVISISPDSGFLHVELGKLELEQGNTEAALAQALLAEQLDSMDPDAFLLQGELYEIMGNLDESLLAYRNADKISQSENTASHVDRLNKLVRFSRLPSEMKEIAAKSVVARGELAVFIAVSFPEMLRLASDSRTVIITDTRQHWGGEWILLVAEAGIMNVDAGYRFNPASTVSRGDLADVIDVMLRLISKFNSNGEFNLETQGIVFKDMQSGHLNYRSAALAVEVGILDILENDTFQPTRLVNGQEVVQVVDRLTQLMSESR